MAATDWQSFRGRRYLFHNRFLAVLLGLIDLCGYLLAAVRKTRVLPDRGSIRKMLLCRNDHMGDVVMVSPLLQALKEEFPSAEIDVVVSDAASPIVKYLPEVNKHYVFNHVVLDRSRRTRVNKIIRMLWDSYALLRIIRRQRYDLIVDLRPFFGNVTPLLLFSNARYHIGYDSAGFGFCLDHVTVFDESRHFVENMFECLRAYQMPNRSHDFPMRLRCKQTARPVVPGMIDGHNYFVMHLGTGNAARLWVPEQWAELASLICLDPSRRIVLLGGAAEKETARLIIARQSERCIDLTGTTTIDELIEFIRGCSLLIGLESLSIHIAAALQKRIVVIHAGIQPLEIWRPWMTMSTTITHPMPCAPCGLANGCIDRRCITAVSAQESFNQVQQTIRPESVRT